MSLILTLEPLELNTTSPQPQQNDRLTTLPTEILLQIIHHTQYVPPPLYNYGFVTLPSTPLSSLALNHRLNNLIQPLLFAAPVTHSTERQIGIPGCQRTRRAYGLLSLLLRNRRLGEYVREFEVGRWLGLGVCEFISYPDTVLEWLSEGECKLAERIIRDVCESGFWDEKDEDGIRDMSREGLVEKRVARWMRDFKAGNTYAYFGLLILLTPNAKTWRKVTRIYWNDKGAVPRGEVYYVALVYGMAKRREEEGAKAREGLTLCQLLNHEKSGRISILPKMTTIIESYEDREPASWEKRLKHWKGANWHLRFAERADLGDVPFVWEGLGGEKYRTFTVFGKKKCGVGLTTNNGCRFCWGPCPVDLR